MFIAESLDHLYFMRSKSELVRGASGEVPVGTRGVRTHGELAWIFTIEEAGVKWRRVVRRESLYCKIVFARFIVNIFPLSGRGHTDVDTLPNRVTNSSVLYFLQFTFSSFIV